MSMPASAGYRKALSKNRSFRPPGRPQRIADVALEEARRTFPRETREDVSLRSVQDRVYAVWALDVLKGDELYRWLCGDFTRCITLAWLDFRPGAQHAWRPTILAALGRLGFPDRPTVLCPFAAQLCVLQPSTREALRLIHQWQGQDTPGTARGLAQAIAQAMERYLQRHPDTSAQAITQALELGAMLRKSKLSLAPEQLPMELGVMLEVAYLTIDACNAVKGKV